MLGMSIKSQKIDAVKPGEKKSHIESRGQLLKNRMKRAAMASGMPCKLVYEKPRLGRGIFITNLT